jgi:hypothetical protein
LNRTPLRGEHCLLSHVDLHTRALLCGPHFCGALDRQANMLLSPGGLDVWYVDESSDGQHDPISAIAIHSYLGPARALTADHRHE